MWETLHGVAIIDAVSLKSSGNFKATCTLSKADYYYMIQVRALYELFEAYPLLCRSYIPIRDGNKRIIHNSAK
jgi:hypothetical protein